MRIDHYAYQRATKVAGIGLLIQVLIGTVLLVFGLTSPQRAGLETRGDTALTFAALYVLGGTLVWLGLVVIFHQHKLERLEALEEDELAAARAGTSSLFDAATDELRVAARRLRLMHTWLMPTISLSLAGLVGGLAWWMWGRVQTVAADLETFHLTDQLGWAVAICLAFATIPQLAMTLEQSAGWFSTEDEYLANIMELQPLFVTRKDPIWLRPTQFLTPLLFLFPLAMIAVGWRSRRPERWLLLFWTEAFCVLTLSQFRFINTVSVAYAIVWGAAIGMLLEQIGRRTATSQKRLIDEVAPAFA